MKDITVENPAYATSSGHAVTVLSRHGDPCPRDRATLIAFEKWYDAGAADGQPDLPLDVASYRELNSDLDRRFGDAMEEYRLHYCLTGYFEGRTWLAPDEAGLTLETVFSRQEASASSPLQMLDLLWRLGFLSAAREWMKQRMTVADYGYRGFVIALRCGQDVDLLGAVMRDLSERPLYRALLTVFRPAIVARLRPPEPLYGQVREDFLVLFKIGMGESRSEEDEERDDDGNLDDADQFVAKAGRVPRKTPKKAKAWRIKPESAFDHYVVLGNNCEVAFQLRRVLHQKPAGFFTWNITPWASLIALLKANFEGAMQEENLSYLYDDMFLDSAFDYHFHAEFVPDTGFRDYPGYDEALKRHLAKFRRFIDEFRTLEKFGRVAFFIKTEEDENARINACIVRDLLKRYMPGEDFVLVIVQDMHRYEPDWGEPLIRNRYNKRLAGKDDASDGHVLSWDRVFTEFPHIQGMRLSI